MSSFFLVLSIGIVLVNFANVANANGKLPHRPNIVASGVPSTTINVNPMREVGETWAELTDKGASIANLDTPSLFFRALAAGCFVGIGGILTASVGFDMEEKPWVAKNGFTRFLSGAVGYPLSILMVVMCGVGAWTGDQSIVNRALLSNRIDFKSVLRFNILSWVGGMIGTFLIAALTTFGKLAAIEPCVDISVHKLSYSFTETFFRGIGGSMLICLAVFMSSIHRDMISKAVAIWFPISTYVILDFEHVLASMYFMFTGIMSGTGSYTLADAFKFFIPATLGNMIGGGLIIGCALSSLPQRQR